MAHEVQDAMARLNAVLTTMKLPDSIKDLPKFNGSKHTLHDFITNVDEIIEQSQAIMGEGNVPITFLRAIRNKITDEADEVLASYGPTVDWREIRANLTTHYADKRNETSLIRDLHTIFQGGDTIEKFYSRIMDIQSTIVNNVRLSRTPLVVKNTKETLYREMCLSTFLAGIREPMGSLIRARNPNTISDALNLCLQEQNMMYIKKPHQPPQTTNHVLPHSSRMISNIPPGFGFRSNYNHTPQWQYNQYVPKPMNANNVYFNHKPLNRPIGQPYSNSLPFNKNQGFYNNQQFNRNHFNNNPRPPLIPPQNNRIEPMDTTSNSNRYRQPTRFPPNNSNFFSRPTGPPKYQVQELFNIEQHQNYNSNCQYYDSNDVYGSQAHYLDETELNMYPESSPNCSDYIQDFEPNLNQTSDVPLDSDETVFQSDASENPSDT